MALVMPLHAERVVTRVTALALLGMAVVWATTTYLDYGTIEPCQVLREKMQREAIRDGSDLDSLVASAVPDSLFNRPVTPARCVGILLRSGQSVDLRTAALRGRSTQ